MDKKAQAALKAFVDAIDATGGVVEFENGEIVPAVDEEWLDLGDAYMQACDALGVEPKIEEGEMY